MGEFLNPKSMITPGIAGAVMMFLVNGLSVPFPELPQRWLALALSLLIGALIVLRQSDLQLVSRLGFWVLNSLVIFVVGFGSNNLARDVVEAPPSVAAKGAPAEPHAALSLLFPSALAQDPQATAEARKQAERSKVEAEKLKAELETLKAENARLHAEARKTEPREASAPKTPFFKKW